MNPMTVNIVIENVLVVVVIVVVVLAVVGVVELLIRVVEWLCERGRGKE